MTKKNLKIKCYICGKGGADSKDHIPPKGIFPKDIRGKLRRNLITVPAHSECNNSFKRDDVNFRNFIITEGMRTPIGKHAWKKVVVNSFRKSPGDRKYLLKRLDKKFMKDKPTNSYIFQDVLSVDVELMRREINRINKGLFYHKFKKPLPENIPIRIIDQSPLEDSLPNFNKFFIEKEIYPNWVHVFPGIFSYFYVNADEDNTKAMTILVFYDTGVWLSIIGNFEDL